MRDFMSIWSNEQGTSWGRWAQSFWWALVDIMEHTSECPTWVVRKLSYSSCISHLTLSEGYFQGILLPRTSGPSRLCQEQALGWWVRFRCLQWDAFGSYGDNEGPCDTGGALPVSAVMGQWHRSGQQQCSIHLAVLTVGQGRAQAGCIRICCWD